MRRIVAAVAVALVAATGCEALPVGAADPSPTPTGDVARIMETLTVATSDAPTDYDRDEFGSGWLDIDGDGCQTRDEILARDLTDVEVAADGCQVDSGILDDPYTGSEIQFVRGPRSSEVQIEHVVALGQAWDAGAYAWTDERR